jgi:hypothetical protein
MEPPVVAVVQIKMVAKQVLLQSPVAAELTLPVVLVQLETRVVQQLDLYLVMVLIFKAAHLVIKLTQKVAVVAVVVTTVVAVAPIKPQVEDQKMVAAEVARATLI